MTPHATTRVCGIIGDPVAHSLSPRMHNAAFAHLGLDFVYVALPVREAALAAAIAGARALSFAGLNVTAPHKEATLACCEPDELARQVAAVNTLVFQEDRVLGSNTDVHGLEQSLGERPVQRAVVVGAGGAARAAKLVLERRGTDVTVLGRTARPGLRVIALDTPEARTALERAELVVDATPVGHGDGPIAWPIDALSAEARVLDLVVRRSTPLLRAAWGRGLVAQSGAEMLLHQGALAFERFTGIAAPIEVMRTALEGALA